MKLNPHTLIMSIALALSLGIFSLTLHWDDANHNNTQSVVIAVSSTPLSAPFYVAEEKNFFTSECAGVKIIDVLGGNRAFDSMVNGEADYATSSDSVMVFQGMARNDFVNIATFVESDNDVKFLANKQLGIEDIADLVGKKIAITRGTASEYFFSIYRALGNLQENQIELVDLPPELMEDALTRNQVDVIATWEPFIFDAINQLGDKVSLLSSKNLYTLSFNLLALKKFVKTNRDTTICLLNGLNRSVEYMAVNPAEAQDIVIKRLGLDRSFIAWVWDDYVFRLGLSRTMLNGLNAQAKWAIQSGLVELEYEPDFSQLMDGYFLQQVAPHAVSIE